MPLLVIAVASVFDDVFFEEYFGGAHSHEVGDGDATGVEHSVGAVDGVVDNTDGVVASRAKVDLRHVEIVDIGIELAMGDLR